jgi:hypothetical protein
MRIDFDTMKAIVSWDALKAKRSGLDFNPPRAPAAACDSEKYIPGFENPCGLACFGASSIFTGREIIHGFRMTVDYTNVRRACVRADLCALCGELVPLEECKTDREGRTVHEECYLADILSKPLILKEN